MPEVLVESGEPQLVLRHLVLLFELLKAKKYFHVE